MPEGRGGILAQGPRYPLTGPPPADLYAMAAKHHLSCGAARRVQIGSGAVRRAVRVRLERPGYHLQEERPLPEFDYGLSRPLRVTADLA